MSQPSHSTAAAPALSGVAPQVPEAYLTLVDQLARYPELSLARADVVDSAIALWRRPGFDTFASLHQLRFEPFEHQLRTAAVVLRQMAGRAILADEVGLGKTIEAGIVLSELRLRGLARRVLVLAPAGLVGQWGEELERKFAIPSVVAGGGADGDPLTGAADGMVVVASLATARRDAARDRLSTTEWDLVVVDEAHRVRNPRTASSKLVRSLQARFMLLLTATPVENRLDDLYHLVSLVRPGHFGTAGDFRRRHVMVERATAAGASPAALPAGTSAALAELRRSLRAVMVRHRRSEVALMLPRRLAETVPVQPCEAEASVYRRISERVRTEGRRAATPARGMALRTVQRLAGSTPAAVAHTLERMGWTDLAGEARAVGEPAKVKALRLLLERYTAAGTKVIVFTSFRETLAQLGALVRAHGVGAAEYHGGMARREKDAAIGSFEHDVDVLLCTESAGEGRNLQFCHAMVNFDLPWNPMQIEQRIGRVHRIGQHHDVVLHNLVTRGTIEERVLDVLHTKLNLFELVVGELDMVLGRVADDFVFEDAVFEAHVAASDDGDLTERFSKLGAALVRARAEHAESRSRTDELIAGLEGDAPAGAEAVLP
jgi:SNF2 family DNA or RNA helicase